MVNCQRGFFDAFAEHATALHWENEWDAQPFRIAATPPRTIGKMLHQIVTANYYRAAPACARLRPRPLRSAIPSHPIPSRPVPSRPVPSHPVPSRPIPSHPIPSHPIPSRPVPSHPLRSLAPNP